MHSSIIMHNFYHVVFVMMSQEAPEKDVHSRVYPKPQLCDTRTRPEFRLLLYRKAGGNIFDTNQNPRTFAT